MVEKPTCSKTNWVNVLTGRVRTRLKHGFLRAGALGSCVAVVAYDGRSNVGGMAHVMLPGSAPDHAGSRRTRYAADAVKEMLREMQALGAKRRSVNIWLVGGANVLGAGHHSPGPQVVRSLIQVLKKRDLVPVARRTGGTLRRSCSLYVHSGRVTYRVGDSPERTLWEPAGTKNDSGTAVQRH
jgi:chemotaxis protein CheD